MSKIKVLVALGVSCVCASVSSAMDLPRYDVESYCSKVASFGGTYSAEMDSYCIKAEQEAYNTLKAEWAQFPDTATKHCDGIAQFGTGGNYEMLKYCIEEEVQAAQNKPKFNF